MSAAQEQVGQDDLQARLARRLRQVDAGERAVSAWMAVQIGGRFFLIPLSHAFEILPWQRPAPVPYTKPWFLGVINWRGSLSGVVDVASYLDANAAPRSEQALAECMLLTLNPVLEVNTALLIDHMAGLKSLTDFTSAYAPAPGSTAAAPFLGNIYADAEGRHWQELNLQRLAQDSQFLAIGL
ncbi:chemotaxis protein CheW [Comamonadaceae bacterium OH2310_COT-174]|uniref:Chemotaxis protein CheW n=1 Tax=Vandammella animalimorsus TaxID=2029117 RepID=A0A2A2A9I5_9BURK|nr:chemotaxis protein CheW [Vandammella animalimorsus]PAT34384.1 chemotaxis protein CheW [Vandammella animalimorsus]RRD64897.1 chemotaxis protein CheW [Comamonadaceae bacterium OH2310_COT-174]